MNSKRIKDLFKTLPNIGRGLGPMLFNALVFYFLNKSGGKQLLVDYTWFLIIAYFMITITGWGLRDFMVKEYSQKMSRQAELFSRFLISKLPLYLVALVLIIVISNKTNDIYLLALFVLSRTGQALLEPLALVNKKVSSIFLCEMILYALTLFLILTVLELKSILLIVTVVEVLRLLVGWIVIRPPVVAPEKPVNIFLFLGQTRLYFFIALFSFCMSRVDAFILGFFKGDVSFSHYSIILTLIAASQIIISAIYNQSIKSVFKLPINKATLLLEKINGQFILLSVAATAGLYLIVNYIYVFEIPSDCFLLILINLYCFCITVKYLFILNHLNKPSYFLAACLFSSFVNSVGSILLIPLYGMPGSLISNTLAAVILVVSVKMMLLKFKPGVPAV